MNMIKGWFFGFVTLQLGFLETTSFLPEGNRLSVNSNVAKGALAVEVLDSKGMLLKGYSKKECLMFSGNETNHQISWGNNIHIPSGMPIRLRFFLINGDL